MTITFEDHSCFKQQFVDDSKFWLSGSRILDMMFKEHLIMLIGLHTINSVLMT